ncbi:uncharacterized protein BDZ99DRAFT_462934 [Mytilinidion resinicola]|uniref:Integral membrane protein-like protein n=1 Tax=Mytilinidion resinicola TaxID=574789 RepID=A0A6A6YQR6_9PEZI|nr:uncharacterized protein BDZ99DRAFT_462934 [Mytilinidion resinicola]KAF2810354.1 hypothetical protein BDZ99DRAFT_462934 [Mytilinidion resinicola]
MAPQIFSQTIQATILSATSNILAQALSAYRTNQTLHLNPTPILKFALYTFLNTPPNCLWQAYLEDTFPTQPLAPPPPKATEKPPPPPPKTQPISLANVAKKLALDQTVSAAVNTVLFLAFMGYLNASGEAAVESASAEVRNKFWPLLLDGYKLWPLFSVVSFMWIPVEKRVVVGSLVGVLWGIYLSLLAEA